MTLQITWLREDFQTSLPNQPIRRLNYQSLPPGTLFFLFRAMGFLTQKSDGSKFMCQAYLSCVRCLDGHRRNLQDAIICYLTDKHSLDGDLMNDLGPTQSRPNS